MKTERLFMNVGLTFDGVKEQNGMLIDATVAEDNTYVVNKMVFLQKDLETKQEAFVVFPKEHYKFRLDVLKDGIEAEIIKAKKSPHYSQESIGFRHILDTTTKKMIFQDGH